MVLSSLRLLEGSACSHRLWGLPSSSDSPSLLHLRAPTPQRHVASFWQGTVEPQPPPHACSVVAWPVAGQGFYGAQPPTKPNSSSSRTWRHPFYPIATRSSDDRPSNTAWPLKISHREVKNYSQWQPRTEESSQVEGSSSVGLVPRWLSLVDVSHTGEHPPRKRKGNIARLPRRVAGSNPARGSLEAPTKLYDKVLLA